MVDYITDKIVELQKSISFITNCKLQQAHLLTLKKTETKQLQEKVKQKKSKAKSFLTDIIRQLGNRNMNHTETSKVKSTEFHTMAWLTA